MSSNQTSTHSYPASNKTYAKPKFHSNSTPQNNQNVDNHQKDYKGKYKGLKAEIAILTKKIDAMSKGKSEKGLVAESFNWDEESVSSEDEGVTNVKAFMAIDEDEPYVGKADARSVAGDGVTISCDGVRTFKQRRQDFGDSVRSIRLKRNPKKIRGLTASQLTSDAAAFTFLYIQTLNFMFK
ncbi:hypothetical protein Tco_1085918, partial [Tanacetum coccineum]